MFDVTEDLSQFKSINSWVSRACAMGYIDSVLKTD